MNHFFAAVYWKSRRKELMCQESLHVDVGVDVGVVASAVVLAVVSVAVSEVVALGVVAVMVGGKDYWFKNIQFSPFHHHLLSFLISHIFVFLFFQLSLMYCHVSECFRSVIIALQSSLMLCLYDYQSRPLCALRILKWIKDMLLKMVLSENS